MGGGGGVDRSGWARAASAPRRKLEAKRRLDASSLGISRPRGSAGRAPARPWPSCVAGCARAGPSGAESQAPP
eukprot:7074143-Pyramimonas_sp.AAC.1